MIKLTPAHGDGTPHPPSLAPSSSKVPKPLQRSTSVETICAYTMEFTSHPGVSRVGRHATSYRHPGEEQLWNIRCLRVREIAELACWDGRRKGIPNSSRLRTEGTGAERSGATSAGRGYSQGDDHAASIRANMPR
jgi:hypothetical protein